MRPFLAALLTLTLGLAAASAPAAEPDAVPTIVLPADAPPLQVLAARELLRYMYTRTGIVAEITTSFPADSEAIVLAADRERLDPQECELICEPSGQARVLHITGGSDVATLYGTYRFCELLGIRFYLHGDVIPDERMAQLRLPIVNERSAPLFQLRGIQPFHDFPEGPDWWNVDDYRAYLSQLVKLRMNFLGLHCYPEGAAGPEPLVWIGLAEDADADGRVRFSYPARWASTVGGAWGYDAAKTREFAAGAGLLFPSDDFGPPATAGQRPMPQDADSCNEVFNRAAELLGAAIDHGRPRGVRFCIGTETPLTIPQTVRARLLERGLDPGSPEAVRKLYEGMFRRIRQATPVDYFWLWTPEDWTWAGASPEQVSATVQDVQLALQALEDAGRPFELATCGWVLGPPGDRGLFDELLPAASPVSCINREVGFTPVEPGFARIASRPQWAIPWLEDDPAMVIPQLWVGRMRRDAADALAFGCSGLMGIHWRTRAVGPNLAALAQAAWSQEQWSPIHGKPLQPPTTLTSNVHLGGSSADIGSSVPAAENGRIYGSCRWNLDGYRITVPDGRYDVTLQFCEIHHQEAGRRVFGARLEGVQVFGGLDVFAKVGRLAPLDLEFREIEVRDGELSLDFTRETEFPFIAGIVIQPSPSAAVADPSASPLVRRINCGGGAVAGYEADLPPADTVVDTRHLPRDFPCRDFYADWARSQFGPQVADRVARIFESLDGSPPQAAGRETRLPRPATWDRGPGGIPANRTPWSEEQRRYAFVDELDALRAGVTGAGNLARFDYWLHSFRYLRKVGEIGCRRGELDAAMEHVGRAPEIEQKRDRARALALPLRLQLARDWEALMTLLLATVSTPGEMGTVANLEQHVRRHNQFLSLHDAALTELLGPLPEAATPASGYAGPPRIIVPTVRPDVTAGQSLDLAAIVLSASAPQSVEVRWRPLGAPGFESVPLRCTGRRWFAGAIPPAESSAIEYHLVARVDGVSLLWPPGAPQQSQTVVVAPALRSAEK